MKKSNLLCCVLVISNHRLSFLEMIIHYFLLNIGVTLFCLLSSCGNQAVKDKTKHRTEVLRLAVVILNCSCFYKRRVIYEKKNYFALSAGKVLFPLTVIS